MIHQKLKWSYSWNFSYSPTLNVPTCLASCMLKWVTCLHVQYAVFMFHKLKIVTESIRMPFTIRNHINQYIAAWHPHVPLTAVIEFCHQKVQSNYYSVLKLTA